MKNTLIFTSLLFLILNNLNAQEENTYVARGINFYLQVGTAETDYLSDVTGLFNPRQGDLVNNSLSYGFGLELMRRNIGYRFTSTFETIDQRVNSEITNADIGSNFSSFTRNSESLMQSNFEVTAGLIRYFQKGKWVLASGIEIPVSFYDISTRIIEQEDESSFSDTDFSFFQSFKSSSRIETPGGIALGIGGHLGLYFNLTKALRIGFNYSPSIRYLKAGGEATILNNNSFLTRQSSSNEPPFTMIEENSNRQEVTTTFEARAKFKQRANFALAFCF